MMIRKTMAVKGSANLIKLIEALTSEYNFTIVPERALLRKPEDEIYFVSVYSKWHDYNLEPISQFIEFIIDGEEYFIANIERDDEGVIEKLRLKKPD